MDKLIRKAMQNFAKECPKGCIRTIAAMDGCCNAKNHKDWSEAVIRIEYVEEPCGMYKEYYTYVEKGTKTNSVR